NERRAKGLMAKYSYDRDIRRAHSGASWTTGAGPGEWLLLRHAQPRIVHYLWHVEHHELCPWGILHDGRGLHLGCAQPIQPELLVGSVAGPAAGCHCRGHHRAQHVTLAL